MYKINEEKLEEWLESRNAARLWDLVSVNRHRGFTLSGYVVSGRIIIIQRYYKDEELVGWDAYVPSSSSTDAETTLLSIDGHLKYLEESK